MGEKERDDVNVNHYLPPPSSPHTIRIQEEGYCENVVQHQNNKVFPNGLDEDRGIRAVHVESNLQHVQPKETRVHRFAWMPFCETWREGESE